MMVQLRLSLVECDMFCNAFCTHVCYNRSSSPLVTWSGTTLNYDSPSTRWTCRRRPSSDTIQRRNHVRVANHADRTNIWQELDRGNTVGGIMIA